MKQYLINRIRERSTWVALGVLGAAFGMPPGTSELLQQIALGVVGLVGVLAPDSKPQD